MKCKDCNQDMLIISKLEGTTPLIRLDGGIEIVVGTCTPILYQCPEDKTIAVDKQDTLF